MHKINIYDNHLPVMKAGEYEIKVTQNITGVATECFASEPMTVYVNGPRFQLSPSEFHHIFPQDGANGDFEGTLPSISFSRSTLLWEREPLEGNDQKAPWLFLLLVDESEASLIDEKECKFDGKDFSYKTKDDQSITVPLTDLGIVGVDDLQFIPIENPIQFIDLSRFGTPVVPKTLKELKYLGYTRIKKEGSEEHCVAVGNRLPKPGSSSTVYLISLENKYKADGNLDETKQVFPVLYRWKFYTNDDQLYSIEANLEKIAADDTCKVLDDKVKKSKEIFDTTLAFKEFLAKNHVSENAIKKMLHLCKLPGGSFHDVMSNLRNGIQPLATPDKTAGIELSGSVYLPFNRDKKNKSLAWYRGPLATQNINLKNVVFNSDKSPLFVDLANGFVPASETDLIFKYKGELDVSYAVAYELGKLTALSDTAFSSAFFEWKHEVAASKTADRLSNSALSSNGSSYPLSHHLPLKSKYSATLDMPKVVIDKFENWKLLKGIPIRYIVPDPTMVPAECIRYFKLDNNWVNAFIMGAFSIGHTPKVNFSAEIRSLFLPADKLITGFFLNSIAVSVWHDYELDCKTSSSDKATPRRKSNLNAFVHLYLFDGQLSELNFHLHPGKLHPGFMVEKSEGAVTYHKSAGIGDVSVCIDDQTKVVDVSKLKDMLSAQSVAAFNGMLMEGTPEVRFRIM